MSVTKKSADAFRTISEAAEELEIPAHVLRFWESKFAQISPLKRAGGRRFYRPQDLQLLRGVKRLLYEDGYTIKGARKYFKDHGVAAVMSMGVGEAVQPRDALAIDAADRETPAATAPARPRPADGSQRQLDDILADLENARAKLKAALEP
ncbi:MerR family transcriptional regulator [uncultured Maricaulis sp.]|uniref:MerR family transcriptional regulator n=1 Tax=uncultured Maricaulis sp. TaxID=174710 RepID=UPI0026169673|nr:MerR family transcriptional regulator [uncultured Maricaulis sp.]